MHWFKTTKPETLEALFLDRLKNLLSMEVLLSETIPRMAVSAESSVVRDVLENLLIMTRRHILRIDLVFRQLAVAPSRGMSTELRILISDCEWPVDSNYDPSVSDAGLIAGAERFTHYKMADYVTSKCLAKKLGYSRIFETLEVNLDEEVDAECSLIAVAQGSVQAPQRNPLVNPREYRRTAESIIGRI
jgi:ferritin-like metal-binding protein YciE